MFYCMQFKICYRICITLKLLIYIRGRYLKREMFLIMPNERLNKKFGISSTYSLRAMLNIPSPKTDFYRYMHIIGDISKKV